MHSIHKDTDAEGKNGGKAGAGPAHLDGCLSSIGSHVCPRQHRGSEAQRHHQCDRNHQDFADDAGILVPEASLISSTHFQELWAQASSNEAPVFGLNDAKESIEEGSTIPAWLIRHRKRQGRLLRGKTFPPGRSTRPLNLRLRKAVAHQGFSAFGALRSREGFPVGPSALVRSWSWQRPLHLERSNQPTVIGSCDPPTNTLEARSQAPTRHSIVTPLQALYFRTVRKYSSTPACAKKPLGWRSLEMVRYVRRYACTQEEESSTPQSGEEKVLPLRAVRGTRAEASQSLLETCEHRLHAWKHCRPRQHDLVKLPVTPW